MYSQSIKNLIHAFRELPSVGERTAERYVFHLLKSGKKEVTELMLSLKELIENVKSCEVCYDFSDTSPCPLCAEVKRDRSTVCVVTDPPDVATIEHTGTFNGVYHVLRSIIDATDNNSLSRTKIMELFKRIEKKSGIKEIILALNPDLNGETTMLYLEKEIKLIDSTVTVSRLARGLPLGADIRYADDITLGSALKNRTSKN